MAANWKPESWRAHQALQMPTYKDADALSEVETRLGSFPPLVFAGEARNLTADLAKVSRGEASCCRAAIAPKALPNSIPTTSATHSACCCRWRSS